MLETSLKIALEESATALIAADGLEGFKVEVRALNEKRTDLFEVRRPTPNETTGALGDSTIRVILYINTQRTGPQFVATVKRAIVAIRKLQTVEVKVMRSALEKMFKESSQLPFTVDELKSISSALGI